MNNVIGGYFELELPIKEEYHKNALRLNTGRNAFEYILRAKQYKKVYLPYYTCDVMLEPIYKLSLKYQFYSINSNLEPLFDFNKLEEDSVFVYTNYFGLFDNVTLEISKKCNNLIIDNSQAFYSSAIIGVDTFYSPRKFFGLPDGAYLYTDKLLDLDLGTDVSYNRMEHLLGRGDIGAEAFFLAFKKNEESLINQPIKKMSKLTQRLLSTIDYQNIASKRKQNFEFLYSKLSKRNQLSFNFKSEDVPMVYPFLIENGVDVKKKLIKNKIFVATYWSNVTNWVKTDDLEMKLINDLVLLPIDQRLTKRELNRIIKVLRYEH